MKKLLVILILGMLSCKKEIPNIVIPAPQTTIVNTITQTKKINYQLFFNFDSLQRVSGYEVMNGPIVIDFDNNGRYDIVVNRRNMSRTQTTYVYEMLNPIVILDNGQIKELPNLWKGGTTPAVADFNGDGFNDIAIMDNGPEFWDLNSNPTKTPLTVYWNHKGVFDGSNTIVTPLTNGCFNIATLDADKDGSFELVPMGIDGGDFRYKFNGTSFDKIEIKGILNISGSPAIFEDFDNNGTLDVFSFGFSNGRRMEFAIPAIINSALNNPNIEYLTLPTQHTINTAMTADVKGNGLKDIIFVCQSQANGGQTLEKKHYLYYYENMGNGKFALNKDKLPKYIIPANNYPMLYLLTDIDGDGDVDFYNVNSLFKILFINDGKGNLKNGLQ